MYGPQPLASMCAEESCLSRSCGLSGPHEGPLTGCMTCARAAVRVGAIQPVDEIGALCREHKAFFHTDAAQAVGKVGPSQAQLPRLGWGVCQRAGVLASRALLSGAPGAPAPLRPVSTGAPAPLGAL